MDFVLILQVAYVATHIRLNEEQYQRYKELPVIDMYVKPSHPGKLAANADRKMDISSHRGYW